MPTDAQISLASALTAAMHARSLANDAACSAFNLDDDAHRAACELAEATELAVERIQAAIAAA